jgi:hypothetical protein
MTETIVRLHVSATGSSSWDPVAGALVSSRASVFAHDLDELHYENALIAADDDYVTLHGRFSGSGSQ